MMSARAVVALVYALSVVAPLSAKGPTVKLVVTGPGLSTPVVITTPAAIAPSVWGGEFIGQTAPAPPAMWKRYTVTFHVLPPRETMARAMYEVQFARDPLSGQAFIYLPDPKEPAGTLNRHTIGREGQDGRWHRAAPAWSRAVAAALP